MRSGRTYTTLVVILSAFSLVASGQQLQTCGDQGNWSDPIPFTSGGMAGYIDGPILLTSGKVLAQYTGAPSGGLSGHPYQDWYVLTPNNGDYSTGTWTFAASLYPLWNHIYGPWAFASAVLPNGHVIVQGGEFNPAQGTSPYETNMGAILDPFHLTDGWKQLNYPGMGTPTAWPYIGDAQSVVLGSGSYNGRYMVAACGSTYPCSQDRLQAILTDEANQLWLTVNGGKGDRNSEEGYVLLPSGKVLTIDISTDSNSYELFDPSNLTWTTPTDDIPVPLKGNVPGKDDIGSMMVLPSGNVFATGTLSILQTSNPANTAIYYSPTPSWLSGPTFPTQLQGTPGCNLSHGCVVGAGDQSAVLLPDGNVFLIAINNNFSKSFYEFVPSGPTGALCSVNAPMELITTADLPLRALLLPTGQVLLVGNSPSRPGFPNYYIYTPGGTQQINPSWRPANISVSSTIARGSTSNPLSGTLLNGMSQANMLGDEAQNATNYPLVQITDSQGTIRFAPTHDHSTMGIGSQGTQTTKFDVPCDLHTGNANLVVIANGIPSNPATSVSINDTGLCHPN
jgi:hypothetical protein